MASIRRKRSRPFNPSSPPVENLPLFVEPISVCTCSANSLITCPYHMMKPSSSDQDRQEVKQERPFATHSSASVFYDFHGVSCPSTDDQEEKRSEASSTPVQFLLFGVPITVAGCNFMDSSSVSSQNSKRKREEESTMENDGVPIEPDHHQSNKEVQEAERLGISLELKLSCEYRKSNCESVLSSSASKESVVCNPTEDNTAKGVEDYSWRFNKKLTLTDVSSHQTRLLLGKRSVEEHLLPKSGFSINEKGKDVLVRDLDTNSDHQLTLATWAQSSSYVLIKNWYKKFVERRELKDGDEIELCWKATGSAFTFRILSRATGD